MLTKLRVIFWLTVCISVFVCSSPANTAGDNAPVWKPVTPEELQMKAPKVEADADAEAIFWEVKIDDKKLESVYYDHYIRVKIFTERGRERFSKFDIPFAKGKKIENVAARVIRPDGSIVDLDPKDIFEREIVKAGKIKVLAKSFAVPGIEPGVIVEYQYREKYKDAWSNGVRLIFQRDIPLQRVSYFVRPQKGFNLRFNFYNMPEARFVEDPAEKGFYVATLTNVPAYKVEPYMPPEDEVRRWVWVSYSLPYGGGSPWPLVNARYFPLLSVYAKPTDLIKRKAAELTAGAASDEEKLRRVYDYVQKQIRNVDYDDTLTDGERDKLKHDNAEDAIKQGMGNSIYLELLFASLAKALNLETNLLFSGDRSDNFFNPDKYPFASFIHLSGVAVNLQNGWRFLNPSVPYVPYGYLPWNDEGVNSMLVAENGFMWRMTPISEPGRSPAKRTAKLKLSDDGTLEGTVRIEYYGQQAISRRRDLFRSSAAKRADSVAEEVKGRIAGAELSDIVIENFDDSSKPLVFSYKVRVPNYAQKTGKRLFFQPGFFEYGVKPAFSSETRVQNIYFSYPWSEQDNVELRLPQGFELDSADQPAEISDPKKIGDLRVLMNIDKAANVLRYNRTFHFGGGGNVLFPVAAYPALKSMFDGFHTADSHILTLKQVGN